MDTPDTPWQRVTAPWLPLAGGPASESTDTCVIGAGIAGLTTAYLLARAGREVTLLDAGGIAVGESSRTSAHLASALDDRFINLERLHGRTGAQLAAASHAAAIDLIERVVLEHDLACDFARLDGWLVSATGDGAALTAEYEAAARSGLEVEQVAAVPGLPWSGPALRFARQGRIDPGAYLAGLAACCRDAGVRMLGGARVVRVEDGPQVEVSTADGLRLLCDHAVVATNVPINDRVVLQTKLEAWRSYVIALRVPPGAFPDALLWDDADPYHYLRPARDPQGPLLVVGGEDHKTGQGPEDGHSGADSLPFKRLEAWARERFPTAGAVVHTWSGQIIEPVDGLAYIGRNPGGRNVHVITGDSGHGLTHGTLGAQLVSDLIRGIDNPWAELYRPSRITLGSIGEYAGHNANVLRQYGDWLRAGDVASTDLIPAGGGAIVRHGTRLVAAHRDGDGKLHTCAATCPHLGGVVRWNSVEGTWDCPCHGSRFDAHGRVLNGPANSNLPPVHEDGDGGTGSFPIQALVGGVA